MPRRATPGHRAAVEAALTPTLRAAIAELCDLLGIPLELWQRVPAFQTLFETAAAELLATRLKVEGTSSTERARSDAAIALGLEPKTLESREQRMCVQTVGGTASFKQVTAAAALQ